MATALSIEEYADLAEDFVAYAETCLFIRPKAGGLIPLKLNRAQRYLNAKADAQLARRGYVRIIGLKGRQQGFSTLVEGRAYWRTTHLSGFRAFILTHEDEATQNLFGMARRFHENCPEDMRPATSAASANELAFAELDSGYKVATAGGRNPGRSHTLQFFHGSEVEFWPNAEDHARGALEGIADAPNTEAWLESTGNGPGSYFHRMSLDAMAGKNGYEFVFVPWYWQEEYVADATDFTPAPEEQELLALYGGKQADGGPGISIANLAWRREKISKLGGEASFRREYPCSVQEAFVEAVAHDRLISAELVQAARARNVQPTNVRPIWGVDAARFGDDESTLCKRQGNVVLEPVKSLAPGLDTMKSVGAIVSEYRKTPTDDRPSHICVDAIGIGAGVADRLREVFAEERDTPDGPLWSARTKIVDVNVGERAPDDELHNKLRDELWWRVREWLEEGSGKLPAEDELLAEDLCAPTYWHTSAGKRQVEPKDQFKKRLKRSPDRGDALGTTFMVRPVSRAIPAKKSSLMESMKKQRGSAWAG